MPPGDRPGLCRGHPVGAVRGGRGEGWVFGKQNPRRHFPSLVKKPPNIILRHLPSRLPVVKEPDSCLHWGWWRVHAAKLQLRPGNPVSTTSAWAFWLRRESSFTRWARLQIFSFILTFFGFFFWAQREWLFCQVRPPSNGASWMRCGFLKTWSLALTRSPSGLPYLKKKRLHEMGIQDEQQIYQEKIKSKS